MERKSAIFVRVEEFDKAVAFALAGAEVTVILQVVEQLERVDVAVSIAVNALECGVGSEIADVADALAGSLEGALAFANSDEYVLKSVLRFKAKHSL